MKKTLLLIIIFSAVAYCSFAQTTTNNLGQISIGFNAGLPLGSASHIYGGLIGGDVKYAYPVANDLFVSLSAGYTDMIGKDFIQTYTEDGTVGTFAAKAASLGVIPVKIGARYYPDGSSGFFAEMQTGVALITEGVGPAFAYSPGIGYQFDGGFEAGLRYEGWLKSGSIDQLTLRLAYNFY